MNTYSSKRSGSKAENLAVSYLLKRGYTLLERNYRYKRSEIDIIMQQESTLVFLEVKYRKGANYGYPEEFVSSNQKRSIIEGAEHYILSNHWNGNIRFDIVAIDADFEIDHFEDAFC